MSSTPAFSEAQQQHQQDLCVATSTALTVLSIIIVGLRTFTRTSIVRNFGKDDCAMIVATVWTIGYLIAIFVLKDNGMGFSGGALSLEQMTNQIKTTLAIEIIYYLVVFSIKLSILFFYLRLAADKKLKYLTLGTIAVLCTFVVICVIVCLAQCIPLHKFWDFTGTVAGNCINTTAFFYSTSTFNILTDIWILALPIPTLLRIQRPKHEKVVLVFVFGLGALSCIASIVRLYSIRIYTESADPFYDSVPINLWSMVEINIGIYCASIPALKALVHQPQRQRTKGGASGYQYHSRDKSGPGGGSNNSKNSQCSCGKKMGSTASSSANRSHAAGKSHSLTGPEAYDMKPLPNQGRRPGDEEALSERSGSQEYIFALPAAHEGGADTRV
ncbi:hypothetical protein BS50DRAFT_1473 [Corynespora cassiicola Philippines]|uniref:Rhodopsin domain-containing protein n=1 Tax=Corynespora cassiicola Philippines TaxID=1448308 RepID=A0A2T2P860_CORCC|nr:hypothetical protein BS50DRAFT_1473 [Corynespora cassiicola Philippines]